MDASRTYVFGVGMVYLLLAYVLMIRRLSAVVKLFTCYHAVDGRLEEGRSIELLTFRSLHISNVFEEPTSVPSGGT